MCPQCCYCLRIMTLWIETLPAKNSLFCTVTGSHQVTSRILFPFHTHFRKKKMLLKYNEKGQYVEKSSCALWS